MKTKTFKFLGLVILMLTITITTFSQASATATSEATIVVPISIAKDVDMNFGNIAVSGTVPGTVTLPAAAAPTRTFTGGITLPAATGTVASAKFTVSGEDGYTYSISLPANGVVSLTGAGTPMAANNFVSFPTVALGGVLTGGSQDLYVGATLSVAAAQAAGTYTSAAFTVTVNYN